MSPTKVAASGGRSALGDPTVDPRLQARAEEVRRHGTRRRRRIVLALVCPVLLVVIGWFILHSPWLSAQAITVRGSAHTPVQRVVSVAGLAGHPPLIDVNPGQVAARLEHLPWVASAAVARHWPDGVSITITERRPVAVVAAPAPTPGRRAPVSSGGWLLVDRNGRVIEPVASPPGSLLHLALPAGTAVADGRLAAAAQPGLEVAASLPAAFRSQVTQVAVDPGGTITLVLTTPVTVDLGPPVDLGQKYEDVAALLANASLSAGDVIDVTVPGAPGVVPSAGT